MSFFARKRFGGRRRAVAYGGPHTSPASAAATGTLC